MIFGRCACIRTIGLPVQCCRKRFNDDRQSPEAPNNPCRSLRWSLDTEYPGVRSMPCASQVEWQSVSRHSPCDMYSRTTVVFKPILYFDLYVYWCQYRSTRYLSFAPMLGELSGTKARLERDGSARVALMVKETAEKVDSAGERGQRLPGFWLSAWCGRLPDRLRLYSVAQRRSFPVLTLLLHTNVPSWSNEQFQFSNSRSLLN